MQQKRNRYFVQLAKGIYLAANGSAVDRLANATVFEFFHDALTLVSRSMPTPQAKALLERYPDARTVTGLYTGTGDYILAANNLTEGETSLLEVLNIRSYILDGSLWRGSKRELDINFVYADLHRRVNASVWLPLLLVRRLFDHGLVRAPFDDWSFIRDMERPGLWAMLQENERYYLTPVLARRFAQASPTDANTTHRH